MDSDTRSARDPRGGNDTRAERKASKNLGSPRATRGEACDNDVGSARFRSRGRAPLLLPMDPPLPAYTSRESLLPFFSPFLSFRPVARRPGHSLRHVSTSFRTTPSRGVRAAEEPAAVPREGFPLRLSRPLSRASFARHGGERPTIARTPVRAAVARSPSSATRGEARERGRKQSLGTKTTLSQAWSGNCIRGPQCAFEMSMFMCPAVHKLTRN